MIDMVQGSRFLIQVSRPGQNFDIFQRFERVQLEGGISLVAGEEQAPGKGFELSVEHLGLVGPGTFVQGKGPTGPISVLGIDGKEGDISDEAEGVSFVSIPIRALVLYDAVDELRGFQKKGDRLLSFVETFVGQLQGSIRRVEGPTADLAFDQGSLVLSYKGGGLGWIRDLAISLDGFSVSRLRPSHDLLQPQFRLRIRPVGFKTSCDDETPSGASARIQLDEAVKIWRNCGIDLDVQETIYVVNPDLKFGTDVQEMRRGWRDSDLRTIEVFFSASSEMPDGGGQSVSCGMANAAIAVTDDSKELPRLVAHEIGHILNGIHPADPAKDGEWNGPRDSVLEPSGGPDQLVVLGNDKCEMARNAALAILNSE